MSVSMILMFVRLMKLPEPTIEREGCQDGEVCVTFTGTPSTITYLHSLFVRRSLPFGGRTLNSIDYFVKAGQH